ncbi:MAG: hypothetical protein FWD36_09305 [Treponema sp.]|nr:hypothetical protein [Treponema sp.]
MAKNTIFWVMIVLLFSFTFFSGCTESFVGDDRKGGTDNSISQQNDGDDQGGDTPNPVDEPEVPPQLSAETEVQIRRAFADWYPRHFEAVSVEEYYGTYNGWIAVLMRYEYPFGGAGGYFTVANMEFWWTTHCYPIVWKPDGETENGRCYDLEEAYGLGFLDIDDLKMIHELHTSYRKRW